VAKIRLIPNFQETTTLYSEIFLQTKLQGNYFCHFFVNSFIIKYLFMKKTLILIVLHFFCLQMTSFATIHRIVDADTTIMKAHLPLKQHICAYSKNQREVHDKGDKMASLSLKMLRKKLNG
jgi:hypothetical protein